MSNPACWTHGINYYACAKQLASAIERGCDHIDRHHSNGDRWSDDNDRFAIQVGSGLENPVEREGIRRAWESIGQADVVIYLVDASRGLTDADQRNIDELGESRLQIVYSKSDLLEPDHVADPSSLYISTLKDSGMDLLIDCITGKAADFNQDDHAFMARRRHVDALQRALHSLQQAVVSFETSRSGELVAEDLRATQQNLNEITGEFTSEDLLGKIFSSFCIGK